MEAVRENLAHLLAWSISLGLTVGDLLRMPFYHPVIEEALQAALYDLYAKVDAKNPGPITEVAPSIEWGYLLYLTTFRICQYFGRRREACTRCVSIS